jgi:hypothetical protein
MTRPNAAALLQHPFILKFNNLSNVDLANFICPIFFNSCELEEEEIRNSNQNTQKDDQMAFE